MKNPPKIILLLADSFFKKIKFQRKSESPSVFKLLRCKWLSEIFFFTLFFKKIKDKYPFKKENRDSEQGGSFMYDEGFKYIL